MKLENLTAEEATEIIQRGGVVEGCTMAIYTAKNADGIDDYHAPYRVVTPPPEAEVVTAEELIAALKKASAPPWYGSEIEVILRDLKAARAPKPEPKPIRTLDEALACERLRLVNSIGMKIMLEKHPGWSLGYGPDDIDRIDFYLDGYDKGRRVYDTTQEQAK